MSIDLKVTLGTVNYLDYLHVSVAKVSAPSTPVWETWIDVPVTNYNFIIPGLDPEDYIVSYYDAPTNVALGTLVSQLIVNALTPEYAYEKRFYKTDRGTAGDPVTGDNKITDPYFTNKTIKGVFREGFRFLEPVTEWDQTTTTTTDDTINILDGVVFNNNEMIVVEIQLAAGTIAVSNGGSFYSGRVDVTASTYTIVLADKGKRHRLVGSGATQVLTFPAIGGLSQDASFLFDNSCGGTAKQVKILMTAPDVILFNGFNSASNNLDEIWIGKGEKLLLAKIDGNFEVLMPYQGTNVGERIAAGFKDHPNTVLEDGQIGGNALDGDEIPRLWWWINNCLPNTHYITDDTVINTSYVHPAGKEGLFVVHSTLKKFRTPNTQNLSERGIKDFDNYGTDAERIYDYPGGVQEGKLKKHRHLTMKSLVVSGGSSPTSTTSLVTQNDTGPGDFKYIAYGSGSEPNVSRTSESDGATGTGVDENRVKNIGVIYLRRI